MIDFFEIDHLTSVKAEDLKKRKKRYQSFFVSLTWTPLTYIPGSVHAVHRYSVDSFSYSGPSRILGSDGKQITA